MIDPSMAAGKAHSYDHAAAAKAAAAKQAASKQAAAVKTQAQPAPQPASTVKPC